MLYVCQKGKELTYFWNKIGNLTTFSFMIKSGKQDRKRLNVGYKSEINYSKMEKMSASTLISQRVSVNNT